MMTKKRETNYYPEAIEKYRKKNPEKTRYDNYRRSARLFLREHATKEDLIDMEHLISIRKEQLNEL